MLLTSRSNLRVQIFPLCKSSVILEAVLHDRPLIFEEEEEWLTLALALSASRYLTA